MRATHSSRGERVEEGRALESVSRQRARASLIFHPRVAAVSDRQREDVYCPRLDETTTARAAERERERERDCNQHVLMTFNAR